MAVASGAGRSPRAHHPPEVHHGVYGVLPPCGYRSLPLHVALLLRALLGHAALLGRVSGSAVRALLKGM